MAHFCGFIKLIFLLLMLARIPSNETWPLKGKSKSNSDLIAGNEFLKLFMEYDQLGKSIHSSEYDGGEDNIDADSLSESRRKAAVATKKDESFDKKSAETGRRSSVGRSIKDKGSGLNQAEDQFKDSKQIVKLVTSGSKIIFLDDYDESDDVLNAEIRDIDLQRETFKQKIHPNLDEFKVVAVSVSSSSQRNTTAKPVEYDKIATTAMTTKKSLMTMAQKPPTVTIIKQKSSAAASPTGNSFVNRSHKSELSIEEVEPLTMAQNKSRKLHSRHRSPSSVASVSETSKSADSENSASTNTHNILAARSTSTVTNTYHSGQRNMTINHNSNHKTPTIENDNSRSDGLVSIFSQQQHSTNFSRGVVSGGTEDQLLPFQTVIYHDTKAGNGPQSRSISYSSISQNVDDLKKWQHSGILAEARRNVSESLKPTPRFNISASSHQSESAKFYSQPSKMYSEPSKFYSEPSKVYSEPSKVYGEPEKIYSEPAKVYGQPSKFYSEPSKVYSKPAKVYSEPSKTYWPITVATTSKSSPSTTTPSTNVPQISTIPTKPTSVNIDQPSRKSVIVSRIAFGEARSTSSTTTSSTATSRTTTSSPLTTTSKSYGSHQYTRTYGGHRSPSSSPNNENPSLTSSLSTSSTPNRRILFNLDRLPYDLLNAPESSIQQQQQLDLQKSKIPQQQTLTYQQQQQQQQRHHINPCLQSAVSSLFSSSTLSAHPALIKQRQQQQNSNQNAEALPNEDLVRCVAEISATAADNDGDSVNGGVEVLTTERSHIEEQFTPTPEQNYEIEESVSVMTNGRAHSSGLAYSTTSPIHQQQHHGFKPNRQRTRIHFGTSVNNADDDGGYHHLSQLYNTNAATNNRHSNSPDYISYDDANHKDDDNDGDDDAAKNHDYVDDDNGNNDNGHNTSGGSLANSNYDEGNNDEDSKVAYVVEGRNYRKYRVEEKTDDGFIVGEYGVVDHNDGNLRGVRYTADSTINRSLIQKALLTFLKLK